MPRLTPEEVADRVNGLGSTDIVEICGLAPWEDAGPMRVYCQKVGIPVTDTIDPDDADWGHTQEDVIAEWYARSRGVSLLPGGRAGEAPIWATLDRKVVGQPRLVEVKNVGSPMLYRHWNVSDQDGIPRYVRAQVNIQMALSGVYECDVVASIGGRPPHVWTVFHDQELSDLLLAAAHDFWKLAQARKAPPLDATTATRDYLRSRYPSHEDDEIADCDDPDIDVIGMVRADTARLRSDSDARIKKYDAQILSAIGSRSGMRGTGWQMTWRTDKNGVRRSRFTAKGGEDE